MKPIEEKQFSSFEEQQELTDNWREYLNEQVESESPRVSRHIGAEERRAREKMRRQLKGAGVPEAEIKRRLRKTGFSTDPTDAPVRGRPARRARARKARPGQKAPTVTLGPRGFVAGAIGATKDPKKGWLIDYGGGKTRVATKAEASSAQIQYEKELAYRPERIKRKAPETSTTVAAASGHVQDWGPLEPQATYDAPASGVPAPPAPTPSDRREPEPHGRRGRMPIALQPVTQAQLTAFIKDTSDTIDTINTFTKDASEKMKNLASAFVMNWSSLETFNNAISTIKKASEVLDRMMREKFKGP